MKFIFNLTAYTCPFNKRGFSSIGFNFAPYAQDSDITRMQFDDLTFYSFSAIKDKEMFSNDLNEIISSLDGKYKLDFYLYTFTNEDIDFLSSNIRLESIYSSTFEYIEALNISNIHYEKKGYHKVYTYYFQPGESIDSLIDKVYTNLGNHIINTNDELSDVDSYIFFIANTVLQVTPVNSYNPSFNFNEVAKRYYSTKTYKSENVLFTKLKNIINNYPLNEDTQRFIENVTVDNNIHRLDKNIQFHDILGNLNSKAKKELINNSDTLKNLINNFVKRDLSDYSRKRNSKDLSNYFLNLILKELGADYTVSVLLGKIITIINLKDNKANHSTSIFVELGTYFVNNYFYSLYKKEKVKKLNKDPNYRMWDWRVSNIKLINRINTPIIHGIGALLFDWLREIDLLSLNVVKSDEKKNELISIIEPSDKLKSYLIEQKNKPLPLPNKLPMIVKPKLYKRYIKNNKFYEELGGYLLNGERYWNEIIIKNWRSKENSHIKDVNIVYSTVNKLSSVKYKINKDVLDFIRLNDKKYDLTLVNKTHPLETKEGKLKSWEKLELESFTTKRNVENSILEIADLFDNIDGFYMPVRLDYRGRIYCDVDYLNYQGTDLAKSLLMFSEGSKVLKSDDESINYLKMYGANSFGNKLSKKSGIDRINWVDENINNIRDYDNGILISQAENKFLFAGFCIEYNKLLNSFNDNNNPYFITHLPIQLDASCNGFQHISMLIQDLSLAQTLNLTDKTYNDIPDDFYSLIGLYLKEYFLNKIADDKIEQLSDKEKDSYTRLSKLDIQRDIIKKSIMTLPYNASSIQLIEYLKSEFEYDTEENLKDKTEDVIWYKYKKNTCVKLKKYDFVYIYHGLKFILSQVFPSFILLSKYFISIAKICSKLGITIPWYLPSGLVVNQSYLEVKESRVKPLNFSNITFSLKIIKDKIHKDKQVRALMPNIIHSLDSLSLMILINKYFDELKSNSLHTANIYTIHDCIAVPFNDMKETINLLKIAYISIYSDGGYLLKLHKGFVEHIKNYLGDKFNEEDLTIEINIETKSNKIKTEILKLPDVNEVIKGTYKIKTLVNSAYILN